MIHLALDALVDFSSPGHLFAVCLEQSDPAIAQAIPRQFLGASPALAADPVFAVCLGDIKPGAERRCRSKASCGLDCCLESVQLMLS